MNLTQNQFWRDVWETSKKKKEARKKNRKIKNKIIKKSRSSMSNYDNKTLISGSHLKESDLLIFRYPHICQDNQNIKDSKVINQLKKSQETFNNNIKLNRLSAT